MEPDKNQTIHIVGGGLAGCEAAWQIAERMAFQNLPVATRQGELFA